MVMWVYRGLNMLKTACKTRRMSISCLLMLGVCMSIVGAEVPLYTSQQGWSCHKCPRGTFLAQDCLSNDPASTQCRNCTPGKFQPSWTSERRCYNCDECDPGLDGSVGGEPLSACTRTENAVCRCRDGFYWSHNARRCAPVTACPPGEGVAHTATVDADTVCNPCRDEAFSARSSAQETCAPCRICEEWQQEVTSCNVTHDRVCQNDSMPTNTPPTAKPPKEVGSNEDSQQSSVVGIAVPVTVVTTIVLVAIVTVIYRRLKNNGRGNDPENAVQRENRELLDDNSSASSATSSVGTPSTDTSSSGGPDSLQYQSETHKDCAATPFRGDGAEGTMEEVYGPGDETYPKSFALEPEGDNPSMPVQETGEQAGAGVHRQDSHDPPTSMDKIEKESAGYAVTEIPEVRCATGPTPVFPTRPSPYQIRTRGDGSSSVEEVVALATRV